MCVNNLSKAALDSAAAGIELATSSRKSNALTTAPPSHTNSHTKPHHTGTQNSLVYSVNKCVFSSSRRLQQTKATLRNEVKYSLKNEIPIGNINAARVNEYGFNVPPDVNSGPFWDGHSNGSISREDRRPRQSSRKKKFGYRTVMCHLP